MTISSILELGKRSLSGYKGAIDTTSNNIANANNPNYNRRRVDLNAITGSFGFSEDMGQADLDRVRNQFAEYSIWRENHQLGKYEQKENLLSQIESILGAKDEGSIGNVLNEFWESWNQLAADPENPSVRNLVKNKGLLLANSFNSTAERIVRMQRDIEPELSDSVDKINKISQQIVDVNNQLRIGKTSDLLDQRDKLVTELSSMINIDVREKNSGEITILTGGHLLVSDGDFNQLELTMNRENQLNSAKLTFKGTSFEPEIDGGKLSALMETFNDSIPSYMEKLDRLAVALSDEVNTIHKSGANVDGTTGLNFFNVGTSGASNIKVNEALVQDPSLIANRSISEGVGANSIAESIFKLQFSNIVDGKTPAGYYTEFNTALGEEINDANFNKKNFQNILQNLENQKDQVSGVSLEEEMTNMVQYEQAFNAAAKIIQTADELMETVLSLK